MNMYVYIYMYRERERAIFVCVRLLNFTTVALLVEIYNCKIVKHSLIEHI